MGGGGCLLLNFKFILIGDTYRLIAFTLPSLEEGRVPMPCWVNIGVLKNPACDLSLTRNLRCLWGAL